MQSKMHQDRRFWENPSHKISKSWNTLPYFNISAEMLFQLSRFYWYFILVFQNLRKSAARRGSGGECAVLNTSILCFRAHADIKASRLASSLHVEAILKTAGNPSMQSTFISTSFNRSHGKPHNASCHRPLLIDATDSQALVDGS